MGNRWWSVLFAVTMLLCAALFVIAPSQGWWLPKRVSTHAWQVDGLFYIILAVTAFFFILTQALLIIFMWQYAADAPVVENSGEPSFWAKMFSPVTRILNSQHKVEMAWTLVPAAILLYIAFAQVGAWAEMKYQSRQPKLGEKKSPLQVGVSARQFEWRIRYPNSTRMMQWLMYTAKSKALNYELRKEYDKLFTKADFDEDGQLDKDEIKTLLQVSKDGALTQFDSGLSARVAGIDSLPRGDVDTWSFDKDAIEEFRSKVKEDYESFATKPRLDDIRVVNDLHCWRGHTVLVQLTTKDVIHSFNMPYLRVKQDALPGKRIPVWFTTLPQDADGSPLFNTKYNKRIGDWQYGFNPSYDVFGDKDYMWDIACAELCGWGHYRMIGRIFVHSSERDFLAWLREAEKKQNMRSRSN